METKHIINVIGNIEDNNVVSILVKNHVLLNPKKFSEVLACIIAAYLKDAVDAGKIKTRNRKKTRTEVMDELGQALDRADGFSRKYKRMFEEAVEAQNDIRGERPSKKSEAGVQIRIGG